MACVNAFQCRLHKRQFDLLMQRSEYFHSMDKWNDFSIRPALVWSKNKKLVQIETHVPILLGVHDRKTIPISKWHIVLNIMTQDSLDNVQTDFINHITSYEILVIANYWQSTFPLDLIIQHCDDANLGYALADFIRVLGLDNKHVASLTEKVSNISCLSQKEIFKILGLPKTIVGRKLNKILKRNSDLRNKFWKKVGYTPICPICNIKLSSSLYLREIQHLPCCYTICHTICADRWFYSILSIRCPEHEPRISVCLEYHDALARAQPYSFDSFCKVCSTAYNNAICDTLYETLHVAMERQKIRQRNPWARAWIHNKSSAYNPAVLYYYILLNREDRYNFGRSYTGVKSVPF